ncbi:MAG: helix-turn-helix domain-containing protein, partial [Phormidesmis sp.]
MSIRQILQVWEHEFSHPHQAIMLALADHAHEDGTGIRPSIKRIAWKTGYSERSVQNIMGQLRDLGLLVIVVPATHNTPNEYKFKWAAVTPKPSFDEYMDVKKERKSRGAEFAPLLNTPDRGAVPVQEGCNSRAKGVQFPCKRGAVPVQEGCSPAHPIRQEPSREPSKETKETTANDFRFGFVSYQQPPDEIDLS